MKSRTAKPKCGDKALANAITVPEVAGDSFAGAGDRGDEIAAAAYYKAERRGFVPGYELEDWLEAEAEVVGDLGRMAGEAALQRSAGD